MIDLKKGILYCLFFTYFLTFSQKHTQNLSQNKEEKSICTHHNNPVQKNNVSMNFYYNSYFKINDTLILGIKKVCPSNQDTCSFIFQENIYPIHLKQKIQIQDILYMIPLNKNTIGIYFKECAYILKMRNKKSYYSYDNKNYRGFEYLYQMKKIINIDFISTKKRKILYYKTYSNNDVLNIIKRDLLFFKREKTYL